MLRAFEVLPDDEQHIVAVEILRRSVRFAPPLSDDQLIELADQAFARLDERDDSPRPD